MEKVTGGISPTLRLLLLCCFSFPYKGYVFTYQFDDTVMVFGIFVTNAPVIKSF